jgi:hypothetical protein
MQSSLFSPTCSDDAGAKIKVYAAKLSRQIDPATNLCSALSQLFLGDV